MNFYGYSLTLTCVFLTMTALSFAMERDVELTSSSEEKHENHPRIFGSIFSRPKPEAEKQHGFGLKQHLGNVLQGGSIGFQGEFRPLAPLHGLINEAKKVIPKPIIPGFLQPGAGSKEPHDKEPDSWWKEPEKKEPEPDFKEPDYKDPHSSDKEKPEFGDVEDEGTYDWMPQDPKDVNTNGPRWEDIGEGEGAYDYTTVPIEEIIQPRIRNKRRAESKVFHVPVEFISNAKPFAVKINP